MAYLNWITRNVRKYFCNPEALILAIFIVLIYSYVFKADSLWTLYERAKIKLQLRLSGQYDSIPTRAKNDIISDKTKASWELQKGGVGVYAIQGRRPHMEDRFNVVNDLEHTETSIYGLFDGHGGEVS